MPRFGCPPQVVHPGSQLPGRETAWVSARFHLPRQHLLRRLRRGHVRGTPLCHAFPSRTRLLLPTHLPPSDASSASRVTFRLQTCLPHRLPPWPRPPPAFSQHPPWHLPHRYVFRCTAACSGHTASLPPPCRILWLHHCVSRHSAMPSGCSALLTHCTMSHDVA